MNSTNVYRKQNSLDKKSKNNRDKAKKWFYASLLILPCLHFLLFFVYVNFNSIKLAFYNYEVNPHGLGYIYTFSGFDNFASAMKKLFDKFYLITNSVKYFAIVTGITLPLSLFFSFYLYKRYKFSGLFKVILFLPQLVSGLIFSLLFRYIVCDVYPSIVAQITGGSADTLLSASGIESDIPVILFFNCWMGFGVNILMFSGSMSNISQEVVEACELDGGNILQEFFHVTLPHVYPTIVSMLIIWITALFTNQFNLMNFFGSKGEAIGSLGYYLYLHSQALATGDISVDGPSFSELSAIGLMLTFVMVPVTLVLRKVLNKIGPSED